MSQEKFNCIEFETLYKHYKQNLDEEDFLSKQLKILCNDDTEIVFRMNKKFIDRYWSEKTNEKNN